MRPVIRAARTVACLSLVLPLAAPGLAQEDGAAGEVPFFDTVDVGVAEVEVVVLDRRGRPVDDLERDDFTLRIDGRVREIVGFAAHAVGDVEPAPRDVPAPAAPGETPPGTVPGGEDGLSLVIYVDDAHLKPGGRTRAVERIMEALDPAAGLAPGVADRFLVVSAHGGLDLMDGWTTDREVVRERLAQVLDGPTSGIHVDRSRTAVLQEIERQVEDMRTGNRASDPCDATNIRLLIQTVSQHALETEVDARRALGTFADLVSALAGAPGRKVVLAVSDGYSQRPGIELFQFLTRFCPIQSQLLASEIPRWDLIQEIQDFDLHAAGNGVTIYALETQNSRSDGLMSTSGEFRFDGLESRMAEANTRGTLAMMASETGGRLITAQEDLGRELGRVGDELRTYYSLAYRPDPDAPPGDRWIKVEVVGRGLRILHRQVTRDKAADERLAERVYGAVLFGFEDNPMGATLELAEASPDDRAALTVPVEIRVPLSSLGLIAGDDASLGRLLLVMTARDGEGRWQPIKRQEVPVVVTAADDPGGSHLIRVEMELVAGTQEIAIGLRDEVDGTTSYLRRDFQIAESD